MARPRTRTKREDRDRRPKKKISILDQEGVVWVDYKDVNLLRRFMSERAKIRARRVTGNDSQQQRAVARAIRVAREMALLPYSVRQTTHRSKGGKGGRDRGDREGVLREVTGPSMTDSPPPRELAEATTADVTDDVVDGPLDREATAAVSADAPVDDAATERAEDLGEVADEASS
jgi:small subunit ribosomal protein S18